MVDLNTISLPDGPVKGAISISQLRRRQGTVTCLLTTVVSDDACKRSVSGARVLCGSCRTRLLAAGVPTLVFGTNGNQVVNVELNEATLIDVLTRVVAANV